jgi:nitroalkane oxidase
MSGNPGALQATLYRERAVTPRVHFDGVRVPAANLIGEPGRTGKRLGTMPVIEHQNVGFMLAGIKMRLEACRYLTWKACHDFERTGGRAAELAIMTKVCCSEAAVTAIYDCMRVVGIASYWPRHNRSGHAAPGCGHAKIGGRSRRPLSCLS